MPAAAVGDDHQFVELVPVQTARGAVVWDPHRGQRETVILEDRGGGDQVGTHDVERIMLVLDRIVKAMCASPAHHRQENAGETDLDEVHSRPEPGRRELSGDWFRIASG